MACVANTLPSRTLLNSIYTRPHLQSRLNLNHWAAKVGKRALRFAGVLARFEHAQVDQPCSGIEFGEDGLDAEVVLVTWRRLNGLDDDVADDGL